MFKFKVLFSILTVLVVNSETLRFLCGVTKSDNACVCKRTTSENQDNVYTIADCARIQLEDFPHEIQLRDDLNVLDLSENSITQLEDTFSSATLNSLKLSHNFIESVAAEFFSAMPNLQDLDLSHNNIESLNSIFVALPKLQRLDLSYNNLKILQGNLLSPLTEIQYLDLSYNSLDLGKLLLSAPKALGSILGLNETINHLSLNSIGLKEFHNSYFDDYENLKYLSLADNGLTNIPVVPYSVEYLDLSGSDFTMIQAKYLNYHSLKVFKLDRLKLLESIHHYAFYNLQALEEVSISNCPNLHQFNELIFGLLSKHTTLPLKKLNLSGNRLKTLNYTYQYLFNNMEQVKLKDNPWNCNCDLLWLKEYDESFLYDKNNVKCSTPSGLKNRPVTEVEDADVPSCFPEKYGKRAHRILLPVLIVLVIMLSALIGYLIFYSPTLHGNRSRLGPGSPYNPTRLEENS